jgi:hypothetical protein
MSSTKIHSARKLMSKEERWNHVSPFLSKGFRKQALDRKKKQNKIMNEAEERRAEKAKIENQTKKINKKKAKKLLKEKQKREAKKIKALERSKKMNIL